METEYILVVDDDEPLLELMAFVIRKSGFKTEIATDGFAAMRILALQPNISVMVTDLMMPGMSGLELIRESRKLNEKLEVVVVTAAPELESAISAMRAYGAYDYLLKPFSTMNVVQISVERAMTHRRLLIERENMQKQIEREAEMLRTLITNTGDAILSANPHGILQIVNPAAAQLLGNDHLEGASALANLPADLAALVTNWQTIGGDLPAMVELPWQNGSIQMVSLTPIQEKEGKQGWVAVLRDITHLKHLEELKNQLLIESASKIRIPLAQAMNALVDLNILTSQNEQVNEVVYRLTQIWTRIQEWGDDINILTRIDTEAAFHPVAVNLTQVLNHLFETHASILEKTSQITLELSIDPALPQVIGDAELLQRLLQGLLNRAVSRSEYDDKILIEARCHQEQVWVSFRDNGPAVSEVDLPHIFDKSFVKLGNRPGSTGLEMALVKTIVDRMGGQVLVGGHGKKGSTVFLCLPCADKPDAGG